MLLDDALPPRDRVETLLELHGNALLRERTAVVSIRRRALMGGRLALGPLKCAPLPPSLPAPQYLDQRARQLEDLVLASGEGGRPKDTSPLIQVGWMQCLGRK